MNVSPSIPVFVAATCVHLFVGHLKRKAFATALSPFPLVYSLSRVAHHHAYGARTAASEPRRCFSSGSGTGGSNTPRPLSIAEISQVRRRRRGKKRTGGSRSQEPFGGGTNEQGIIAVGNQPRLNESFPEQGGGKQNQAMTHE